MAGYGGGGGGGGGGYPTGFEFERPARQEVYPFFVSGEGIKRQVIQTDLPRYLGNNAYSKPGQNPQGIHGYYYRAYRPLTDAQIRSLKLDSQKWSNERELMSRRYPNHEPPGYEVSATFRDSLQTNSDGSNPDHPYPSFPPPNPGPANQPFPPYNTGPTPNYPPYNVPPAPPNPGTHIMADGRPRFEWVNLPEGGKYYDHELKQYVSHHPPSSDTTIRPSQNEPPTTGPDEPDGPYRRQMDPSGGDGPYYGQGGPYYR